MDSILFIMWNRHLDAEMVGVAADEIWADYVGVFEDFSNKSDNK